MKRLLILCLAIALVAVLGISITAMAGKPSDTLPSTNSDQLIAMETGDTGDPLLADIMENSGQGWFIKFDGVNGEAQDAGHLNWSEIVAFSQLIREPDGSYANAAGRKGAVIVEDIALIKVLDKASPKLAEALLFGKVFSKVEIHVTREYVDVGRVVYYAYELKNVLITSYQVGGTNNSDFLTDEISLNFEEIKVTYTEFDATGTKIGTAEYTWKVM
jgi:type VI secretion system secreted protein Hcp